MTKQKKDRSVVRDEIPFQWMPLFNDNNLSKDATVDIKVYSRKLKGLDKSPNNILFRTHNYEFVIRPNKSLFEWAGRNNGFHVTLTLYKSQQHDRITPNFDSRKHKAFIATTVEEQDFLQKFHEFTCKGAPVINYQYQERIREGVWTLNLEWPSDAQNWKGDFCFKLDIFRRISDVTITKFMSMVTEHTFTVYSKPEVYLKQVEKKNIKTNTPDSLSSADSAVGKSNQSKSNDKKRKSLDKIGSISKRAKIESESLTSDKLSLSDSDQQKKRLKKQGNRFYEEYKDTVDILGDSDRLQSAEYLTLMSNEIGTNLIPSHSLLQTPQSLSQQLGNVSQESIVGNGQQLSFNSFLSQHFQPFLQSSTGTNLSQSSQGNQFHAGSQPPASQLVTFSLSQETAQLHMSNAYTLESVANPTLEPEFDSNGAARGVYILTSQENELDNNNFMSAILNNVGLTCSSSSNRMENANNTEQEKFSNSLNLLCNSQDK